MELITILLFIGFATLIFVITQLVAILFLLRQNDELTQDINDSKPPF
jgi:hypothetical protein